MLSSEVSVKMLSSDRRAFIAWACPFLLVALTLGQAQVGGNPNTKQSVAPRSAIEKKVKAIIVEQLGVDQKKVTMKARFVEDLGADSLDMVELIMAFEEAFDIEIPDEDAGGIRTVQNAVDYISTHAKVGK